MGLWSLMNVEVVATVILVAAWRACVATSTQTHAALSTQSLAFSSTEVFASSTQPPTASSTESLVALSILELVASSTQAHAASPVTLPPQNTDFLNFTLRKCRCEKNNVLDGSGCRRKSTEVVVYNPANKTSVLVKTSDFSSVRIEDVKCDNGTERVTLNIATNDFVLFAGQMVWVDGSKVLGEYCIEHLVRGEELHQVAHICLPPPQVPQCCPPGHLLAPDDSCVPSSNRHTFAPPILFNNDLVPWKDVDGNVKNVTCDGIPVVRRLYLNTQEGELMYSVSGTLLRWTPLFWPDQKQFEQNYCVGMELDKNNDAQYIAKFCYVDLVKHHQLTCSNNTCVRKCCAKNEIILIPQCIMAAQVEEIWEPSFHILQEKLTSVKLAAEKWTLVTGNPLCSTFYQLDPLRIDDDKFYLLENGSLHIPKHQTSYPSTHYCVDSFLTENGTIMEGAMLCTNEDTCSWKTIVDVVLLGISCVFLAITLGVYMGVAELRDRTYGRCLISMVAAMLSTYITLIINNQVREQSDTQCIIRAFIGHVCSLATFFWLNVMCYDMWSTLRSSQQKHHSKKVFMMYSLYAWGCPLVVGVIALIIDNFGSPNLIRPDFTGGTCWFHGNAEYWLYLSGIIFLLVMVNLFFFVHVAVTLARDFKQRKTTFDNNTSHSSNSTKTKSHAWLYIKLFIVMGIVWIAEAISSVHHRNTCTYWIFADIFNGLQGVFIFIVTVCNKDNIKKIKDAWRPRLQNVQKTMISFRGQTTTPNANRRGTDFSMAMSESSRKTSVTSLPRKCSVASSVFHSTSNKTKRATALSDTSETSRKSAGIASCRKSGRP
nr:G-protein coupled receptor Mth2-like isoform X2 [Procambarus clarkii]